MARSSRTPSSSPSSPRRIAVIGAGLAGLAAARTLLQAGHAVEVFESQPGPGGRLIGEPTHYGSFDTGAQYFTVRDRRLQLALERTGAPCKRWSANAVRVLDAMGRVVEAALPTRESHWVAVPHMGALAAHWAAPLGTALHLGCRVLALEADTLQPRRWQLRIQAEGDASAVHAGFDAVLLAVPPSAARALLAQAAPALLAQLADVQVAPCWSLQMAFPQASQPGLPHLGPQWNCARSTHHRVAWVARESSKPGRGSIERWTVQASADWSREHLSDDASRVQAKLQRAFAEITGIRVEPAWAEARLWAEAKTQTPLGRSHLWDAKAALGLAGDWCIGHRVEDAFISGLELALAVA
ncbi:FAD-dependent oxidoreductase [Xenophilus arseniciresistens]|uniref:FAD-dependent oxidoreductase n=1 Tax=Xenophilus arseniciresistens TaxID=1283306 RepID=A0AAE3NAJ4_9BURK|nr:FAD-dependent oxidoreductase [Xenophilus arseniciresistens]MDA7417978.1 FAD-dependent oxidoreductase [Xenophilus arseniciresistens]